MAPASPNDPRIFRRRLLRPSSLNGNVNSKYIVAVMTFLTLCWMVCFAVVVANIYRSPSHAFNATAMFHRAKHEGTAEHHPGEVIRMKNPHPWKKEIDIHEQLERKEVGRADEDGKDQARNQTQNSSQNLSRQIGEPKREPPHPNLLSRSNKIVSVTKVESDVRGNLGPASVVVQDPPGTDWLKHRWQAASNMHGQAIPGAHWLRMAFDKRIVVSKLVLDWETAYASEYQVQGLLEVGTDMKEFEPEDTRVLFDSRRHANRRSASESGQSPGVKAKMPLHVVHTIDVDNKEPLSELRIWIRKPAHPGWGVSLWECDVYGYLAEDYTSQAMKS